MASDATRKERSTRAAGLKDLITGTMDVPGCQVLEPLRGANASAQYNACIGYQSLLDSHTEPIRVEVDIDHAVQSRALDSTHVEFVKLLRLKLSVPGTAAPDASRDRMRLLEPQLDGELRPVLREADFASFDLQRAVGIVSAVARRLE